MCLCDINKINKSSHQCYANHADTREIKSMCMHFYTYLLVTDEYWIRYSHYYENWMSPVPRCRVPP